MPMRESDIEKHLAYCAKNAGGEVRKVKWVGRRGAPDRLVMLPGSFDVKRYDPYKPPRSFYVELKRPGKKATDAQAREHGRMRDCGIEVRVVSTVTEVEELFT